MTTTSQPSLTPWANDAAGGTKLDAPNLNQRDSAIMGAYDFKPGEVFWIRKDPTTGFWPSGWNWRTPIYSGGAVDSAVAPTADLSVHLVWQGPDPSPGIDTSGGTAGMREGDERIVENP